MRVDYTLCERFEFGAGSLDIGTWDLIFDILWRVGRHDATYHEAH